MKKIVGIMAAAAIATSVFAADIAAATKISGKLFDYDADKTLSLFTERNDSHDYAQPNFTMSISDDKAGATVKITTNNYGGNTYSAPAVTTQTIWFKPVDALKITVGDYDIALNKEQIDWTESKTALGGKGFLASVNVEGLGIDFGIEANEQFWIKKADGVDASLTPFFVKASYGADFGTIGGFAKITLTAAQPAKDAVPGKGYYFDEETGEAKPNKGTDAVAAVDAKKDILFGAGYRNNFSGVDAFLNVVADLTEKLDWVRPELYAGGSADAFGYQLFVAPLIYTNSDLNKDAECEVVAKVTYAMDGFTPYAYFKDANLLAKDFAATVKLGATGSVGAMGWNAWVQLDVADKTAFSVPFELTMSF